uniref:Uncharacterized protein n=1 Tax=Lactuca sativa TaxID=4236 RepID=A0A9R1WGS8_LACSA|nr:hypothetical protein LSAT_V11C200071900 [Lactuca sativa]
MISIEELRVKLDLRTNEITWITEFTTITCATLGESNFLLFCPIVTSAGLAKNKVVRPEDLSVSTRSVTVHVVYNSFLFFSDSTVSLSSSVVDSLFTGRVTSVRTVLLTS